MRAVACPSPLGRLALVALGPWRNHARSRSGAQAVRPAGWLLGMKGMRVVGGCACSRACWMGLCSGTIPPDLCDAGSNLTDINLRGNKLVGRVRLDQCSRLINLDVQVGTAGSAANSASLQLVGGRQACFAGWPALCQSSPRQPASESAFRLCGPCAIAGQ